MIHKKISVALGVLLCALVAGFFCESCSHSTSPAQNDTIRLVSDPQVIHVHTSDTSGSILFSIDSIRTWLTNGSSFSMKETVNSHASEEAIGYSEGFEVIPAIPDSIPATTHYLSVKWGFNSSYPISLRDSSELGNVRIVFSALDAFGNTKYDTLSITATFD